MPAQPSVALPLANKRLNLTLSERAHADLAALADERNTSLTELVRLGLGLLKIAHEESRVGNKLIVTTPDGKALKEIALPASLR
jgi:hypothetical protein